MFQKVQPQLIQCEIDYLSSPITIKRIEFLIRKLLKKIPPGPDNFTSEVCQTFKGELKQIPHNFLENIEEKEYLPIHFMMSVLP